MENKCNCSNCHTTNQQVAFDSVIQSAKEAFAVGYKTGVDLSSSGAGVSTMVGAMAGLGAKAVDVTVQRGREAVTSRAPGVAAAALVMARGAVQMANSVIAPRSRRGSEHRNGSGNYSK